MVRQPSSVRLDARSRMFRQNFILIAAVLCAAFASAQVAVTTYHYDNYRTGWNSEETALTVAAVGSSSFGVLGKTVLDDQVDAQPLVVPNVTITTGKFKNTVHSVQQCLRF